MRGGGACARGGTIGVVGFVAAGVAACGGAPDGVAPVTGAVDCVTGGGATAAWAGGAGTGITGVAAAEAGGCATGGVGTEKVGLGVDCGTMTLGAGTVAEGGGVVFTVETTGAAGEALTGGRAGGATALTGACCLRMAFRTSPGREIFERSILVLISSLSTRLGRDCLVEVCASLAARR
jgi:hypothetical protein